MFKGPDSEAPLGTKVRFEEDNVRLPIYRNGINPLVDDRVFPYKQIDYEFLDEQGMMMNLPFLRKVAQELSTKVDPKFDVIFHDAKHGVYLKKHLKTNHVSPRQAARLTASINSLVHVVISIMDQESPRSWKSTYQF